MKRNLLASELRDIENVLFGKLPYHERIVFKHMGISFPWGDLQLIQHYADRVIRKGLVQDGFDFIHSPNCGFGDRTKIPNEIYAEVCWSYYTWLKDIYKRDYPPKPGDQQPQGDKNRTSIVNDYNTQLFSNQKSFEFFKELMKELKAEATKNPIATVSFIYWKMRNDALINETKHIVFIAFVKQLPFDVTLSKIKTLQKSTTEVKEALYKRLKKIYIN